MLKQIIIDTVMRPLLTVLPLLAVLTALLSSCSGDDYVNAVPANSIALMSVDLRRMADECTGNDVDNAKLLNRLLHVENAGDCGMDLSEKIYMFESAEGNLGVVAKVKSRSDLDTWLDNLANAGVCRNAVERGDIGFAVMKDSWIVGFSSSKLMIMGPVIASQHAEVQQTMAKYLKQDEENGIKGTPLYDKLDSIDSPVALVARANALPEKFVAPFMIGAPKDADASQIVIAAALSTEQGGMMKITGETFSFNKGIDRRLKEAYAGYRPITDEFVANVDASSLFAVFMNVDGAGYISLLHEDKAAQVLLAGMNMAVDMDNIIRSVDGDMALVVTGYDGDRMQMQLGARLKTRGFLDDVDYWKQSAPKGSAITDNGKDAYRYSGGDFSFCFGVSADNRFYAGSTEALARGILQKSPSPFSPEICKALKGQRMCMLVNVAKMAEDNEMRGTVMPLLVPVMGKVGTILYIIR